jgi:hypothetical protein
MPLGGDSWPHLLVELEQALAREVGFSLQQLQAGAEFDQFDGEADVLGFDDYGFVAHGEPPSAGRLR